MPTYHPAYLLRNPAAKKDVWEDMKVVRACSASPSGRVAARARERTPAHTPAG